MNSSSQDPVISTFKRAKRWQEVVNNERENTTDWFAKIVDELNSKLNRKKKKKKLIRQSNMGNKQRKYLKI